MLISEACPRSLLLILAFQRVTRCISAMTKSGIGLIADRMLLARRGKRQVRIQRFQKTRVWLAAVANRDGLTEVLAGSD